MQLGPEFAEALDGPTVYCDPDAKLMRVRPPEQNNGIDASIDLLRSFHDFREESGFLSKRNVSETSGFELWYDNEELQFLYYTPNGAREDQYRKQIDGHFKGSEIDGIRERFVSTEAGEYIAGGEVWLSKHFFEPIRSKQGGVEDWDDPYLMLFSELDTRDSTRTMFQMLFRPAEPDWTRTAWENVDDYADKMREKKTSSKFFGLIKSQRDATGEESEYAESITRQAGRPAFFVNIRYAVVAETPEQATEHAENVATRLRVGYQEITGQTLDTAPCETDAEVAELVRKIAAREPSYMPEKRGLWPDWKFAKFGDHNKKMVMTLPEIAGIIHFPKSKEVGLDAIAWTKQTIDGKLPASAKRFYRLDDDQRIEQLQRWVVWQKRLIEDLGLDPEAANFLAMGNPQDEDACQRVLEEHDEHDDPLLNDD
jgi:hypothetical protein